MFEIELIGLDGSNLLAFLAALGAFRLMATDDVKMKWKTGRGFRPIILHPTLRDAEEFLAVLGPKVCGATTVNRAWEIGKDLTLSRSDFRDSLVREMSQCGPGDRAVVDFLAAFGSEAIGSGPKKEQMSDTEFRTMSGAGHQHFLAFMGELAAATEPGQIDRTLFRDWDYHDGRPSLRWDPADYRPHALRAEDPSKDPIRTMRGANRLAVEALPLFPTVPTGRMVRTVGFRDRNKVTEISWPIWNDWLELDSISSLLAAEDIQQESISDRKELERRGVIQVFRAQRFTEGKYRNFTPSRALL